MAKRKPAPKPDDSNLRAVALQHAVDIARTTGRSKASDVTGNATAFLAFLKGEEQRAN